MGLFDRRKPQPVKERPLGSSIHAVNDLVRIHYPNDLNLHGKVASVETILGDGDYMLTLDNGMSTRLSSRFLHLLNGEVWEKGDSVVIMNALDARINGLTGTIASEGTGGIYTIEFPNGRFTSLHKKFFYSAPPVDEQTSKPTPEVSEYAPAPVDTNDVVLPSTLVSLGEKIAENVHEVWAAGRVAEGWRYGPVKDSDKKTTPCMVPYDKLSESEKDYDRNTAMETLKLITKLGYEIRKHVPEDHEHKQEDAVPRKFTVGERVGVDYPAHRNKPYKTGTIQAVLGAGRYQIRLEDGTLLDTADTDMLALHSLGRAPEGTIPFGSYVRVQMRADNPIDRQVALVVGYDKAHRMLVLYVPSSGEYVAISKECCRIVPEDTVSYTKPLAERSCMVDYIARLQKQRAAWCPVAGDIVRAIHPKRPAWSNRDIMLTSVLSYDKWNARFCDTEQDIEIEELYLVPKDGIELSPAVQQEAVPREVKDNLELNVALAKERIDQELMSRELKDKLELNITLAKERANKALKDLNGEYPIVGEKLKQVVKILRDIELEYLK